MFIAALIFSFASLPLLYILFMFLYRNRGRAQEISTEEDRIVSWAMPVLIAMFITGGLLHFPIYGCFASGGLALAGISMGHSFAQSPGWRNYLYQALIAFTRMGMILLPLWACNAFQPPMRPALVLALLCAPLCAAAGAIGYSAYFQRRTLKLFGVTWCVPGDSSWEELFVGGPYGLMVWICLMVGIWHTSLLSA